MLPPNIGVPGVLLEPPNVGVLPAPKIGGTLFGYKPEFWVLFWLIPGKVNPLLLPPPKTPGVANN